jgi:hypothetical protein
LFLFLFFEMLVDAERPGRVHVPSMVFLTVCVCFFFENTSWKVY